jgi:multidrug efflux pump subunit AcrA (membrane-fusion protein)
MTNRVQSNQVNMGNLREGEQILRQSRPWLMMLIVAFLVAGCGGSAAATEEPTPLEESFTPVVSATGEIVPAQWATLSFPSGGRMVTLAVEEGDEVSAGDVLAELDTTALDAAVVQAQAALTVAEATLARVQAGPREEEIEQAQQQLQATQAAVVDLYDGGSESDIAAAQADVLTAQQARQAAQGNYDFLMNLADHHGATQPGDWAPMNDEQNVRLALNIANQQLDAAEAYLNQLTGTPDPDQAAIANAQVWAASARRDAAQAALDVLLASPLPEDIAIAEAEVAQAQAGLTTAQAARDQGALVAPFDGVVSALFFRADEWIGPGEPVMLLADLSSLQVETTDLNEIDIARVAVGDAASIEFDSLPNEIVTGTVLRIAPMAAEGAGVNYTAIIALDEIPSALRWGMTAFVDIEVAD